MFNLLRKDWQSMCLEAQRLISIKVKVCVEWEIEYGLTYAGLAMLGLLKVRAREVCDKL